MKETYWRYVDQHWQTQDWLDPVEWKVTFRCVPVPVLRRTPKGAWVQDWSKPKGERFIGDTWRKKWAHPNKADAWESFLKRKHRQLDYAHEAMDRINRVMDKLKEIDS
jgi:hypothetical protein